MAKKIEKKQDVEVVEKVDSVNKPAIEFEKLKTESYKAPELPVQKTFAEMIGERLNGKLIEVMIGESYEELQLDQMSSNYPAVIIGRVLEGAGNLLLLDCAYIENRAIRFGKKVYLFDYTIQYISECDGKCNLEDLLFRSKDVKQVLKAYNRYEL